MADEEDEVVGGDGAGAPALGEDGGLRQLLRGGGGVRLVDKKGEREGREGVPFQ